MTVRLAWCIRKEEERHAQGLVGAGDKGALCDYDTLNIGFHWIGILTRCFVTIVS
jgi:hypothetical protein